MNAPDAEPAGREVVPSRDAMDTEACLYVLSLLLDDRPVDPELAARARRHAAAHPEVAETERDWRRMRAALAAAPARRAREGFTERVLAAAGVGVAPAPVSTLRFARRLAVAASLTLAVSLGFDLVRPDPLQADAGVQRARHAADHFRAGPFDADDIRAGLRARLRDAGFGARRAAPGEAR
jgi:anti-sigma factor RsiW